MVGNLKNYTKIDILRCLLKIDEPISRLKLSEILNLGEGTIRSILAILKENGFLESDKNGHYLSIKGNNLLRKIKKNLIMKEIELNSFFPGEKKIAIQIRHPKNIERAYILRDIAVKNGAEGTIILRYDEHNKKLKIFDADYVHDLSEIESKFNLGKYDVVVISYANSYRLAEHGALALAVELNTEVENLMKRF